VANVLGMRASSEDRDFYDADVPTDADPSPLRQVILAQAFEPGGAVVLLFTSATLESADDSDTEQTSSTPDLVADTAGELQLGAALPELFTADAYLLQSALGDRLLPGEA